MLFVDGENFTMRAQKVASTKGIRLTEGDLYRQNTFIWFPLYQATANLSPEMTRLQRTAIRGYYYTSLTGDDQALQDVRNRLWSLGFTPHVFKRDKNEVKAKGVDISLTIDVLSHAYKDNYEVAVLVTGDADYTPLIEEVKRQGKIVYVWFFAEEGLNPRLRLVADEFFDLTESFIRAWTTTARPR